VKGRINSKLILCGTPYLVIYLRIWFECIFSPLDKVRSISIGLKQVVVCLKYQGTLKFTSLMLEWSDI